ncbi:MAG: hypothetical protein JWN02_91 [Acidobacteria bacterium]|nr:hypothetical protein [Acidobacteriota bacterium]
MHRSVPACAALSMAVLLAGSGRAAAASACGEVLQPRSLVRLGRDVGLRTYGVAWGDERTLLLATFDGVKRYDLRTGKSTTAVSGAEVPAGIPAPSNVAADPATAIAFNDQFGEYAFRLADGARVLGRRSHDFQILDAAVRGRFFYFLGFRTGEKASPVTAIWRVELGAPWSNAVPLYAIRDVDAAEVLYTSLPPQGGSLAVEPDGTVDAVIAGEAGVIRIGPDGKELARLGASLRQLEIAGMPEVIRKYARRPDLQYSEVFNRGPIADDLVLTPEGPALIVRSVAADRVRWELWLPDGQGVRMRYRLGVDRPGPFGHMRCEARGKRLACVFGLPGAKRTDPDQDRLALFELPSLPAHSRCSATENLAVKGSNR